MTVLRTPEERFANLPGFPFQPCYVEIQGIRVHYVDEGQGETILCLHGEPSWSYLYRKLIPSLSARHRILAMDFPGFGRSDKFAERESYSFQRHHDFLVAFLEKLALADITLVVQDWGGLIGLTAACEMPKRFSRLVIMNTGLMTGDRPVPETILQWRYFVENTPDLPIGQIIKGGTVQGINIPPDVIAAYEAPFPDKSYKAGASAWPLLIPIGFDDPGAAEMRAARTRLSQWQKPALVMFSDSDPITGKSAGFFRKLIPTAKDQPEITIINAGHFLQEDKGEEIAQHILEFIDRTPIK